MDAFLGSSLGGMGVVGCVVLSLITQITFTVGYIIIEKIKGYYSNLRLKNKHIIFVLMEKTVIVYAK